jgi:hypothetical protein
MKPQEQLKKMQAQQAAATAAKRQLISRQSSQHR